MRQDELEVQLHGDGADGLNLQTLCFEKLAQLALGDAPGAAGVDCTKYISDCLWIHQVILQLTQSLSNLK